MNDGKPFTDDYLKEGAQPFFANNDYNQPNRDPRLYETMLVNGARYGDHAAEIGLVVVRILVTHAWKQDRELPASVVISFLKKAREV